MKAWMSLTQDTQHRLKVLGVRKQFWYFKPSFDTDKIDLEARQGGQNKHVAVFFSLSKKKKYNKIFAVNLD